MFLYLCSDDSKLFYNWFLAPFAILWIGAVPSYILTLLHLIANLKYKNAVHIMHCVVSYLSEGGIHKSLAYESTVGADASVDVIVSKLHNRIIIIMNISVCKETQRVGNGCP